jgi:hypothetical protein
MILVLVVVNPHKNSQSGDNWIGYYLEIVERKVESLNSPKTHLIDGLMSNLLDKKKLFQNYLKHVYRKIQENSL